VVPTLRGTLVGHDDAASPLGAADDANDVCCGQRRPPTPDYIVDLYQRLPAIPKRLIQVDGSVYWMLSHQRQATALIADWLSATGLTVKT
jgi:hypothetical protein